MTGQSNRTGTKSVHALATMLSERDRKILELVRAHRLITTRQLQRLLFDEHATADAGTRACNRVLTRLRQHRFLDRLERPVGGIRGGSSSYVWMLGPAGDRITRDSEEAPRVRGLEPTPLFLAHTLAVAEARVLMEEASRVGTFDLVGVTTEPSNWRTYAALAGTTEIVKPDLYLVTAVGEFEDHWFIEIDQGTESIPTLIRKCLTYERYRATGLEQRRSGIYPIVVWVLPDPRRRDRLIDAIRNDDRLDARIFRVVSPDMLVDLMAQPGPPGE